MNAERKDGRVADQLRPVKISRGVNKFAVGSALVEAGETKVLCCVSIEEKVPMFLRNSGQGWLTAEYAMLPLATPQRSSRDNYASGRSQEIKRLIGRALRAALNLKNIGERTLWVDCDVLQADGGTRTAAINGAFVALADALDSMRKRRLLVMPALKNQVAATSVGIVGGKKYLDLAYSEDSIAGADFNVVMTGSHEFIELQGTGETVTFSKGELDELLALARKGIDEILSIQKEVLGDDLAYLLGK